MFQFFQRQALRSAVAIVALFCCIAANSQARFIGSGWVEYEKTVNVHKQLGDGFWSEEIKKTMPQFSKSYHNLLFDETRSLYTNGREETGKKVAMWADVAKENITYTDVTAGRQVMQKQVFENMYLITDSLLPIEWKITDDTRTIAGFECRKAVGRFNDTLYVVAFYAEEILVPSGPESVGGLPGLILGLAVPRINTTWFATKVELTPPKPGELQPPTKGKKSTRADMLATVAKATKDWGDENKRILQQLVL